MITPSKNCSLCPRLKNFRNEWRIKQPNWFNSPVKSYGSINSKLLIVGLAPGLRGANKTGRPFTGDYAGKLLYPSLLTFSFAKGEYLEKKNDGLKLLNCRITNSVRCAPPQNKPTTFERNFCRKFLNSEIRNMQNLKIILALGQVAHIEVLKTFDKKLSSYKFRHGEIYSLTKNICLFSSYHCSKYNTLTKRLTEQMFHEVIKKIRNKI